MTENVFAGGSPLDVARPDAAVTGFDRRVYESIRKVLLLPDEFKEYMARWLDLNQPPVSVNQLIGVATGHVYDYTEFAAPVAITATTEAGADTVVTAAAVVLDGSTPIRVEVFFPYLQPDSASASAVIIPVLYDGAASIGRLGNTTMVPTGAQATPAFMVRRLTPSAGSHTYSARAYVNTGTGSAGAGVGGSGAYMPGFINISKA